MRNLFDQYQHVENRLTHAVGSVLHEDRRLLRSFLKDLVRISPPRKARLKIFVQQYPGGPPLSEAEAEEKGIPDIWICDIDQSWAVFVESKVQAHLNAHQIERHRTTAFGRLGFNAAKAVAITVNVPKSFRCNCQVIEWREVYSWLTSWQARAVWAARLSRYMEALEIQMAKDERKIKGTLTRFSGISYDSLEGYTYFEAKRLLILATEELRKRTDLERKLGMDPRGKGRPAITNDTGRVWDFLPLKGARNAKTFTQYPHLTLGIHQTFVEAMVTVPHGVNSSMRRALLDLEEHGFANLLKAILKRMEPLTKSGVQPWFRGSQRWFPSQKAKAKEHARLEFDLRTAFPSKKPYKTQPAWATAGYQAFVKKNKSNYQFQVGALIPLKECAKMKTPDALSIISKAWIACKPLVDLAR
jgi:hypothetical protein